MRVMVIDGQGGGVGKALIEALAPKLPDGVELLAFGTNSSATAAMKKAGAHSAATGENAICYFAPRCDIILGTLGIIAANSIMGELTPKMAEAISSSDAVKILLPMNQCNLLVVGISNDTLPVRIRQAADTVLKHIKGDAK